jgi:hypothetical protein
MKKDLTFFRIGVEFFFFLLLSFFFIGRRIDAATCKAGRGDNIRNDDCTSYKKKRLPMMSSVRPVNWAITGKQRGPSRLSTQGQDNQSAFSLLGGRLSATAAKGVI